jgi:hypothetical protein
MRTAHRAALLTTVALASIAMAASPASAQEEIEVSAEGGDHCNPCVAHAVSTQSVQIDAHIFGIEFTDSVCANEFDAVINEDGSGALTNQSLTGAGCNREPCPSTPWPISVREGPAGSEIAEVRFCLRATNPDVLCTIDMGMEDEGGHSYGLHADSARCHGVGEPTFSVSGEWVMEDPILELQH